MQDMKMTLGHFQQYCAEHTAKEVANLLAQYVEEGQPEDFLPNCTSRYMCALAAEYFKGRCGGNFDYMDFYSCMWGGRQAAMDESEAESRKERHVRCGIEVDT